MTLPNDPLVALTVHQPYSWLLSLSRKPVENRGWMPPEKMLGKRFAIHSGTDRSVYKYGCGEPDAPTYYVHGAVESVATLQGAFHVKPDGELVVIGDVSREQADTIQTSRYWVGPCGFIVTDVVALAEPVPCRGYQKFWALPDEVSASVRAQEALVRNPPSTIHLHKQLPLVDVFGRVEREMAAAFLVLAMRHRGNCWMPVAPRDVARALESAPPLPWAGNPFCRPHFPSLISEGFAYFVNPSAPSTGNSIGFTMRGITALMNSPHYRNDRTPPT